ncbi:MAG TPA: hypothetical protein VFF44_08800 [Casimicrobiaceae bacterium]|nr:hypothetical protein [Casimicrobiaceae bacterium]
MSALKEVFRPRWVRSLVLSLALLGTALSASASVYVSVSFAPPPIPVYEQPLCPGPLYIWVPGYWAYGPEGYYWVPGTWVLAPFIGALWTPGYWGWSGTVYVWHPGYWGRHVGFYGGIDYGYGYFGVGYSGGYWNGGAFYYNVSVSHVDTSTIRYTYRSEVRHAAHVSRVSYNGGPGGTAARATAAERIAAHETHRPPTPIQVRHERLASRDRSLFASVNHGSPPLAATPRAAAFGRSRGAGSLAESRAGPPSAAADARPEFHGRPATGQELHARSPGAIERRGEPGAARGAPRAASPEASRETRVERSAANRSERIQAAPRTEAHAMSPSRAAPREQAMPRREMHAQSMPHPQAAPRVQPVPRAEMHAQSKPHPESAPRTQPVPRAEMHAQSMPRPQAAPRMQPMPRPEVHAQAPRPEGAQRQGHGGDARHEERGG